MAGIEVADVVEEVDGGAYAAVQHGMVQGYSGRQSCGERSEDA